jgi:hypothetical protein
MKKLKQRFQDDPIFAITVLAVGATVLTGLLKATAKTIESSAYAYRASKL